MHNIPILYNPKFKVNDMVWFIENNDLYAGIIVAIKTSNVPGIKHLGYAIDIGFNNKRWVKEDKIFRTQSELILSQTTDFLEKSAINCRGLL